MAVSTIPGAEITDLEGTQQYEDMIFTSVLKPSNQLPQVKSIELHDSGLRLTLPEGMSATEDRYDEYKDQEYVIYFIHPPENPALSFLTLTTIRKEEFAGKRLHELDSEILEEQTGRLILGVGEVRGDWLPNDSQYPMLSLREIGKSAETPQNLDVYNLVAMKDGWLIATTYMDLGIRPLEEGLTFQMNCMRSMLAGDGKAPSFEPEVIRVATQNGELELRVPYGYDAVARGEDDYLLVVVKTIDQGQLEGKANKGCRGCNQSRVPMEGVTQ